MTPEQQIEATRLAQAASAQVGAPSLGFYGTFRLHFNRHGAAPLVWCVATDAFEIAVANVVITAPLHAVYRPKATPDDEDGKPSAWLEVTGCLSLTTDGIVTVAPAASQDTARPAEPGARLKPNITTCSRCGDRGIIQGIGLIGTRPCDCAAGDRHRAELMRNR